MKQYTIQITYTEFDDFNNLPESDRELITQARKAAIDAYAPYSGFKVGAAVLLENGEIILGSNQENAAYPSGLCAERTALFYASAKYPKIQVRTIAVTTINKDASPSGIAKPCGACRQVIAEYEDIADYPIRILLDSSEKILLIEGVDSLLPFRFKNQDLK